MKAKKLWSEVERVGEYLHRWIGRLGPYDDPFVKESQEYVSATTTVYYLPDPGLMVVEQASRNTADYAVVDRLPPRYITEKVGQSEAIRRSVALADEWKVMVAAAIPAPRTDAELWQAYEASTDALPY